MPRMRLISVQEAIQFNFPFQLGYVICDWAVIAHTKHTIQLWSKLQVSIGIYCNLVCVHCHLQVLSTSMSLLSQ